MKKPTTANGETTVDCTGIPGEQARSARLRVDREDAARGHAEQLAVRARPRVCSVRQRSWDGTLARGGFASAASCRA
jgi:hypothetical protein